MLASACASSCLAVRRARSRFPGGIDLAACWEHKLIRLAFCAGGVACEVLARYSRVAFVLYAAVVGMKGGYCYPVAEWRWAGQGDVAEVQWR